MHVLLCTIDQKNAEHLATRLVEEKLAACVNLMEVKFSVYEWQGKICKEPEILCVIKTSHDRLSECQEFIRRHHPYEVPEIVVLEAVDVNESYLNWVLTQTNSSS